MLNSIEHHLRWEPLPGLPEHPFETVRLDYDGFRLAANALYALDPPFSALRIDFGQVNAFKAYEEFSDPWMDSQAEQPMIANPQLNPWVWPLQRVENSAWIKRVVGRNGGLEGFEWQHFVVVTMDISLHVMSVNDPASVELVP